MLLTRRRWLAALGLPLAAAATVGWRALPDRFLMASAATSPSASDADRLAVTCASGHQLAILDPASGAIDLLETGAAPHGLALHPDGRAFVATAEGVAV